ncbi:MAG: methylmalonyl Co-A mutase-associated GTPase MeaB [Gemmatimonadota bacterium]|jgi:LAO/AO transport system kinase
MNEAAPSGSGGELVADLVRQSRTGRKVALARAISLVENRRDGYRDLLHALHGDVGRARRIGVTGPPGAGKSTLVAALTRHFRGQGERVAIIAVDPTSPYTGGALLGDRIRMGELALDPDVFIRSMATRGSLGGLAVTTEEVCDVADAFGFDRIFIETVGVGQTELDIASTADSTLVVLVPESGDGIQAMKAGLMEVADLFVVNKADRPGADRLQREISLALHLRAGKGLRNIPAHHGVDLSRIKPAVPAPEPEPGPEPAASSTAPGPAGASASAPASREPWSPPVVQTVAETGQGVEELATALGDHADWLDRSGERARRRRERLLERVRLEVDHAVKRRVWEERGARAMLDASTDDLERGAASPYEVAERIVERALDGRAVAGSPESRRPAGGTEGEPDRNAGPADTVRRGAGP